VQCALVCVWCLDTSLELVPAVVYPAASDSGWCESRSFGYVVGGTFTCFVASAAAQVKVLRKELVVQMLIFYLVIYSIVFR